MAQAARERITYANVAATVALFAALGGAVAVGGVVDKQGRIKACYAKKGERKGEVRLLVKGKCKRAERSIRWNRQGPRGPQGPAGPPGTDAEFSGAAAGGDLSGTYPNPTLRTSPWVDVGDPGVSFGLCDVASWSNLDPATHHPAGFLRDRFGFVHLRGVVQCASDYSGLPIFALPEGYRPDKTGRFAALLTVPGGVADSDEGVAVAPNGTVTPETIAAVVSLDGISFRCAPSGVAGCP